VVRATLGNFDILTLKFCSQNPTVGQGTAVKIPHSRPKITRHIHVFQHKHTIRMNIVIPTCMNIFIPLKIGHGIIFVSMCCLVNF
jgi:hypothetical protein